MSCQVQHFLLMRLDPVHTTTARLKAMRAALRCRMTIPQLHGPVALHGKARKLLYESPVTGEVVIFDHDPR